MSLPTQFRNAKVKTFYIENTPGGRTLTNSRVVMQFGSRALGRFTQEILRYS